MRANWTYLSFRPGSARICSMKKNLPPGFSTRWISCNQNINNFIDQIVCLTSKYLPKTISKSVIEIMAKMIP